MRQETVSGSSISLAICKSAPRSRQITTPAPHHSVFLQAGCPSCRPTNSFKALKAFSLDQSALNFRSSATQSQRRSLKFVTAAYTPLYSLPRTVYESSCWTSKEAYETSHNVRCADRLRLIRDVVLMHRPAAAAAVGGGGGGGNGGDGLIE